MDPTQIVETNSFSYLKTKGDEAYENKDFVLATTYYQAAINLKYDKSHLAYYSMGVNLYNNGQYTLALDSFNKAIKGDKYPFNLYCQGLTLDRLGKYEEAITSYNKCLKSMKKKSPPWPSSWPYNMGLYEKAHTNKGVTLIVLERYEEALESFDEALKYNTSFHEAWTNRAIALYKLGRYEEASESYYDPKK